MVVKVEIRGSRARVRSEDDGYRATIVVSAPLLARMGGRSIAFFEMKPQPGGGKKDWDDGRGVQFYPDPVDVVELGDRVPDQEWERSPKSVPPPAPAASRALPARPGAVHPPPHLRMPGFIYDADSGERVEAASPEVLARRKVGEVWSVDRRGGKRRLVLA